MPGLGPTHHSCEDIAWLRSLPGMAVVCPADPWEARAALRAAVSHDGPVYLRLGKKGEPPIHGGALEDFAIGRAMTISEGSDVCLLATGTILPEVIEAAELLRKSDISCRVVSMHTVKPLDEACLEDAFSRFPLVATIEEHSVRGGFGSAVLEWLNEQERPRASLLRFGTPDAFFEQSGEQEFAREALGLSAHDIARRIAAKLTAKPGRAPH